jgi:subtilase family serine protease
MPTRTEGSAAHVHSIPRWQARHLGRRACQEADPGEVRCDVLILSQNVQPNVAGWGARDIEAAYDLPSSSKGSGQLVAIVDYYDNPNAASDLAEYRSHYHLPAAKFYKYNQDGQQSHYPKGNIGSGAEIDLDVEMVSASCPNCTIYLVEANNSSGKNLYAAEAEAVKLGAHIVSNSWGAGAGSGSDGDFNTPGVVYLASAGDDRYGVQEPADFDTVVSIGGTILSKRHDSYNEVVWPDTGGGCATKIPKPSWQKDPGCSERTANDVAAVAWNVAAYDTYGNPGWITVGGTSVSTPIIAGAFALAGNATKQDGGKTFWTLSKKKLRADLHVISSGNNGCPRDIKHSYLCTAGTGEYKTYSGPTGWGTPNGIGAF